MINKYVEFAKRLRKTLHELPEPSMHEEKTKNMLMETLHDETKLTIIDCGTWFYAVWRGEELQEETAGDCLAFRADYDAVTGADGISRHLCGHDGHAAILAAFGKWISDQRPKRNIILLFQPGEESGEGALVCRELFQREQVREIYGFHNIPGFSEGKILLREGTFACASTGLYIYFQGAPSHAAYPEYGKNPALAVSELILQVENYINTIQHRGILLSTVIGIDLGSDSYGVSASEGILRLTVRAEYQEEFDNLLAFISKAIDGISGKYELISECREVERFPATENHSECVYRLQTLMAKSSSEVTPELISEATDEVLYELSYEMMEEPRRWSEDFGWYLKEVPGALVGVGVGCDWPQLHTENYEFNDAIIAVVLEFYKKILL